MPELHEIATKRLEVLKKNYSTLSAGFTTLHYNEHKKASDCEKDFKVLLQSCREAVSKDGIIVDLDSLAKDSGEPGKLYKSFLDTVKSLERMRAAMVAAVAKLQTEGKSIASLYDDVQDQIKAIGKKGSLPLSKAKEVKKIYEGLLTDIDNLVGKKFAADARAVLSSPIKDYVVYYDDALEQELKPIFQLGAINLAKRNKEKAKQNESEALEKKLKSVLDAIKEDVKLLRGASASEEQREAAREKILKKTQLFAKDVDGDLNLVISNDGSMWSLLALVQRARRFAKQQ